ncbi:MAG: ATP-binding protein [Balneolaceae bacterium]|nr:ATP-binding protein [Balneolaceae bacterium]
MYGDEDKIEKVITNLIANAIKFCDEGDSVEIGLTENDHSVTFTVRDTGIGIAEEKLPHIFDPFISTGNENADYRESMGIGLTITKEYVHLHHGDIAVESKKDEFTTFTVSLPKGSEHFSEHQILTQVLLAYLKQK